MKRPFLLIILATFAGSARAEHPHHHCDRHCPPRVVTVTNTITRTVHVTNTVTLTRTNTVVHTNTVAIPCPAVAGADFEFQAGHSYRVVAAVGDQPWALWGIVRPGSNTTGRVLVPAAGARPILWQVLDWTPGHPPVALAGTPPDCAPRPTWLALGPGRVLQARP